MPSRIVNLQSDGSGFFELVHAPNTLTIVNPSKTSSVQFVWKLGADLVTLAANYQVEFNESEAQEVTRLEFLNGAANGTVIVTYSHKPGATR